MIRDTPRPSVAMCVLAGALTLAACTGDDEPAAVTGDVPDTVAIGVLPDPLSDSPTLPPPPSPPTTVGSTPATTLEVTGPIEGRVGDAVLGDRILFIGDGTLASAAPPADQQLCDALSLFGWEAEIDAVAGTDNLGFVSDVLDQRVQPADGLDWDAVALFVGNELPADELGVAELTDVLDEAITGVAPRPVVLYTLSEIDIGRVRFNDVIRSRPQVHPNVVVIDWAELGGEISEVVADDGVGLADDGLKRLPLFTADALGEAPVDQDGGCLDAGFPADG